MHLFTRYSRRIPELAAAWFLADRSGSLDGRPSMGRAPAQRNDSPRVRTVRMNGFTDDPRHAEDLHAWQMLRPLLDGGTICRGAPERCARPGWCACAMTSCTTAEHGLPNAGAVSAPWCWPGCCDSAVAVPRSWHSSTTLDGPRSSPTCW